ncbi:MAG: hypothetical protein EU541_02740 [Promethearchaeota archaeon]|nr:MAG: hypothetical protein EU541_02740 [Candidatus Lokiarchaeota archaeon]
MPIRKLNHNQYDNGTFRIKEDGKIKGLTYGIIVVNKHELFGLIECIDLIESAYPIPQNLRERVENRLLPRFYEIQDIVSSDLSLPEQLKIEISNINYNDIIYGLESSSICKLLRDKGFNPSEMIIKVKEITFRKYL